MIVSFVFCAVFRENVLVMAPWGQATTQSPHRMHSLWLGVRNTSTSILHAWLHAPQAVHLPASISKRPNLLPIVDILKDHGDEIFRDADSVIMEIDVDKEIVKQTLHYAQKYGKKVYGVVANMSIALERRDFLQSVDCFVCNLLEAGILFSDNYEGKTADEMVEILARKVQAAQIPSMIVTMGGDGAVYADREGNKGFCPARQVKVKDTAGAGDAFCAGAAIGLTYGKSLGEACEIGAHLAASVIVTSENVCPRFLPRELGLDLDVVD